MKNTLKRLEHVTVLQNQRDSEQPENMVSERIGKVIDFLETDVK